jgi:hypothetical protein
MKKLLILAPLQIAQALIAFGAGALSYGVAAYALDAWAARALVQTLFNHMMEKLHVRASS